MSEDERPEGKKATRKYRAVVVASLNRNLFELLRANVPEADKNMSIQTMLVAPKKGSGFYLLSSQSHMTGGAPGVGQAKAKCSVHDTGSIPHEQPENIGQTREKA